MIPELLSTALAFYRAPGQYPDLRNARVPLPAGVTELLAAHAHALGPEQIDDTAARLGSSPEECRAAVTFFIKQALLEARGDHYRTLGVARDTDSALIRQHYHYLIRLFHPDRDLDREGWQTLYAPAINEAWNQLRTPAKRRSYDAGLPQPDAFDAVLARATPANDGTPARAPDPRARARPMAGVLARLSPRLVLGLLFGLPLLLILLWLLARPAPQELRIAERALTPIAPRVADTTAAGEAESSGAAVAAVPVTRAAPRRATSAELEQEVRERLAGATSAVLGPGAAARPRRAAAAEVVAGPELVAAGQPAPATAASPAAGPPAEPAAGVEQAPAAAPLPGLPALDGAQLGAVVAAFTRSYEAGDAQQFSDLFAENADSSDARGRAAIRDLYRDFFARPETREIRFGEMLWEYHSPFRSRGTGPARVSTVPLDGGEPASGQLIITLEVEQTPTGPAIVGLYYQ